MRDFLSGACPDRTRGNSACWLRRLTLGCAVLAAAACAREPGPHSGPTPSAAGSASGGPAAPGLVASSALDLPGARAAALGSLLLPDAYAGAEPAVAPTAEADLPSYRIDQAIDADAASYRGTVTIDYPNPTGRPLSEVPLLLHPNAGRELGLDAAESGSLTVTTLTRGSAGSDTPGTGVDVRQVRPTLVIARLDEPVAPGARLALTVRYEGKLRRLSDDANDMFAQAMGAMGSLGPGAAPADYGLLAVGDGIFTVASAYPMVAPFRDGAFDTAAPAAFGDLAYNGVGRFAVRTVVPKGVTLVSNLVDAPPEPLGTDKLAFDSAGSFVRDFVLVGGRDLQRATEQHGAVRVSSVYRARDAAAGQAVLHAAVASLGSYERRFGPYPYSELDVAEASLVGGAGGVEFSSMVLIAGMLYRSPEDSTHPLALLMKVMGKLNSTLDTLPGGPPGPNAQKPALDPQQMLHDMLSQTLEFTVAHEVAHQYFAGIVGNDCHRWPSLDEPIAQYAAGLALEDAHGKAAADSAMDRNVKVNYAVYRMLGGPDRAVLRDTASFASAAEYAGLVYGKAPYAYVTLRRKLGDTKLHAALRTVVTRYRFGLLTTEQWITAIEEAAGGPASGVRPTFQRWLEQAHGDADLSVDDSGSFLFDMMFPPEVSASMRQSFGSLGIQPRELFRVLMGAGLGG